MFAPHTLLLLLTLAIAAAGAARPAADADGTCPTATDKRDYVHQHVYLSRPQRPIEFRASDNFLDAYQDGVRAYLANDWAGCVEHIERAIRGYRDFYAATSACRLRCRRVASAVPYLAEDVEDMQYYESIVRRTLCLVKCKQLMLPAFEEFFEMSAWSQEVFRSRKPYAYLQLCLYRVSESGGWAGWFVTD